MTCQREAHRPCFDQEELELLTELAEQIGMALAVSRLRASLHAGERLLVDFGQRLQTAEESERRRMALSIHDGLAQVAASVCQQLELIAHRYQPSCDAEGLELKRARDLAQRTVREARQLIAGLRPVTLETHGLGTAVCEEIESLRADGWSVRYLDGLKGARFPADVELDVFRVVQEALCNARKHAGRTSIDVNLELRSGGVHFEVRDHGAGFNPSAAEAVATSGSHVGLGGMRERIARLGGTLRIEPAPVRGTCVKGDVPV
jgi:signal transduction histidine kinase